jgi:CxxC motif-containing protein (DUF1111 family)
VLDGEYQFEAVGCTGCHVPSLPLDHEGWIFSEPNPYNPTGNLQPGNAPLFKVDLTDPALPTPRLAVEDELILVPAFTDLKLHDIFGDEDDPNIEPLDMNQPVGSNTFFAGNRLFLTRKLWGVANEPPYFHHGQFTTLRQAILAHDGEARDSRLAFEALDEHQQNCMIEFLKTLQILPPGTKYLIVDEFGHKKEWPPSSPNKERGQ